LTGLCGPWGGGERRGSRGAVISEHFGSQLAGREGAMYPTLGVADEAYKKYAFCVFCKLKDFEVTKDCENVYYWGMVRTARVMTERWCSSAAEVDPQTFCNGTARYRSEHG